MATSNKATTRAGENWCVGVGRSWEGTCTLMVGGLSDAATVEKALCGLSVPTKDFESAQHKHGGTLAIWVTVPVD